MFKRCLGRPKALGAMPKPPGLETAADVARRHWTRHEKFRMKQANVRSQPRPIEPAIVVKQTSPTPTLKVGTPEGDDDFISFMKRGKSMSRLVSHKGMFPLLAWHISFA